MHDPGNPHRQTKGQKHRKADQQNLATAKAYQMRLTLQDIFSPR